MQMGMHVHPPLACLYALIFYVHVFLTKQQHSPPCNKWKESLLIYAAH